MNGVKIRYASGRKYYKVAFQYKGVYHRVGLFKDKKEAAKAYDMYIIKNRIPKPTNFLKKQEL